MIDKTNHSTAAPTAVITGASKRLGAAIAWALHSAGYRLILHAYTSAAQAEAMASTMNAQRPGSARVVLADLCATDGVETIAAACTPWAPVELLVNNASQFYATPLADLQTAQWEELRRSNLDAPLFLSQAMARQKDLRSGTIINLLDAQLPHGLPGYSAYAAAKAGLQNLTRTLARELAPRIRVNAIAPGAILWPDPPPSAAEQSEVLRGIPLQRLGEAADIASAVLYLASAPYVTGQILAVDGGRGL